VTILEVEMKELDGHLLALPLPAQQRGRPFDGLIHPGGLATTLPVKPCWADTGWPCTH